MRAVGWLVLAGLTVAALVTAADASAAEIPGGVTSVSTTASNVGQWDYVRFSGQWAVPDGSKPGDTFSMRLPAELAWVGSSDFNLTDASGDVVAKAHVDANGLVTFTLTDYVATHASGVHGDFSFETQYTAAQTAPGTQTLIFPVGGTVIKVPITVTGPPEPCTANCTGNPPSAYASPFKWMWWTDNTQTRTQSVIGANVGSAATNDVTVTDTPKAGLLLDCTTLVTSVGLTLDGNGNITDPDARYQPDITCSSSKLTVHWSDLPPRENVRVRIISAVSDPDRSDYGNTGSVVINGTDAPVHSTLVGEHAGGTGTGTGTHPGVTIVKYDTADGATRGLQPSAPGKELDAGTTTAMTFVITNSGSEPLIDVTVADRTATGPSIVGLSCNFAPLGGPGHGTTWAGPLAVKASFTCTGTIPALPAGSVETDTATVTAQGRYDAVPVSSHSAWHGHVPAVPAATRSPGLGVAAIATTRPAATPTAVDAGRAGGARHGDRALEIAGALLLIVAGAGGLTVGVRRRRVGREH